MFSHAPAGYRSPFMDAIEGLETPTTLTKRSDVVYRDDLLTAFISLHRYTDFGGNALIVPNTPFENLYVIPDDVLGTLHAFSKRLALAFKAVYGCDGVMVRQHNEPAGSQYVWHYHLHVIPRSEGDGLYAKPTQKVLTTPHERVSYAEGLRRYFAKTPG